MRKCAIVIAYLCTIPVLATFATAQSLDSRAVQESDAPRWNESSALPESLYRDFMRKSTPPPTDRYYTISDDYVLFGKYSYETKSAVLGNLKNEAGAGNTDASIRLGAAFELGLGTPVDEDAAFANYLEAAKNNNAAAQRILGRAYMTGIGTAPNYSESIKWLSSAYELGDRNASIDLAKSFQYGLGVPFNAELSETFWKVAVEERTPEAFLGYAEFLVDKKGISPTEQLIKSLIEEAADQDDPRAIKTAYQISVLSQDTAEQKKWLDRLVSRSLRGDVFSALAAADAYASRNNGADNRSTALSFYKIAADKGSSRGQALYGSMLLDFPDLAPHVTRSEAKLSVEQASKSGEPAALITLAGLAKTDGDPRKAYNYAVAASELGGNTYFERAREIRLAVCAEGVDAKCEPVPVFYITNRDPIPDQDSRKYQNRLGTKLSMGHSLVTILTDDTVKVEQKSFPKLLGERIKEHFGPSPRQTSAPSSVGETVNDTFDGGISQFLKTVKVVGEDNKREKILVFVHGFANSFDDTVRRLALISEGSKYPGVPLVLSWASAAEQGISISSTDQYSGFGYLNDMRTVNQSCADFQRVLEEVIDIFGSQNVTVLAHSMGGQLVDYFLTGCPSSAIPWSSARKIDNLVLAAPDVDTAEFSKKEHLSKVLAGVNNVTLYVSANDLALRASQEAGGKRPRLGQGGPVRFLAKDIMTVDATTVEKTNDTNHAYVFDTPQVKRDLSDVIHGRTNPYTRDCTKPETDPTENLDYFLIQPTCTN